MKTLVRLVSILALLVCVALAAQAQQTSPPPEPAKLSDLLTEAEHNNPRIRAVRQSWQAAQQVPTQVSTLPDPQFMVQQFSVGSPRPFAGYTNSDFAYIGFGISQDLPYPGKLHLRGEVAKREAEIVQQNYEAARRSVLAEVKAAYFRLGFVVQSVAILGSDGQLLDQVEQAAAARYRAGMGNQQDVIQAQLEKTKLLREITTRHLEEEQMQAQLKQLLNRTQSSTDVAVEPLSARPLDYTYEQLLSASKTQNPEIAAAEKMVERQNLQVDVARKDFYPDFNLQYMWQRTDPTKFRAYYMLTFGIRVPIYRRRKQRPELAQAEADLERSRSEYQAQTQQTAFELRDQYVLAEKTAELLNIYREGLVPQAQAEFRAGLASYQGNRQDFQALLASFLDVLRLDEEYWQTAAERETALARLEQLSGLALQ